MYRRLFIAILLATAVTGADAQARYTVTPSNSAPSAGRGYAVSTQRSQANEDPADAGQPAGKGGVGNRYIINFPKPERERIVRGNPYYRGRHHRNGYYPYYPYYPYASEVYLETSVGPDFNALPSAYTTYGPNPMDNAASASALDLAYRQGAMEQRMVSLADEVSRLRAEKEARTKSRTEETPRADESTISRSSFVAATLVFLDGSRLQIGNHAVVGNSLWVFDEDRSRKISLDSLDLPATRKLNAELGLDFKIPTQK